MADKTTEAIDRMKKWLRENGYRCASEFVADANTLIEAAKGEQRQELVRRFALAIVARRNWGERLPNCHVWQEAQSLADAEPKDEPLNEGHLARYHGKDGTVYYGRTMEEAIQACNDNERE